MKLAALLLSLAHCNAWAAELAVIYNASVPGSHSLAEYYARKRGIAAARVIRLTAPSREEVTREEYNRQIRDPVRDWLKRQSAPPRYLVLCHGVPLRIGGLRSGRTTAMAAVDSELAAEKLRSPSGGELPLAGALPNPYFARGGDPPPIFLVTRLAGFRFSEARALVDRALAVRTVEAEAGLVVLDQHEPGNSSAGNRWLQAAARRFPPRRVRLEQTRAVLQGIPNVIAYAGWGSNDRTRRREMNGQRDLGMGFLPGAIAIEYVSTNARTFQEPPPFWRFGEWGDPAARWGGSVQSLVGDLVRQGVTGTSGHVAEPFLDQTPRPDLLFPAYLLEGRTLGEAFWLSIPSVSWMNVVVGDPLCRVM